MDMDPNSNSTSLSFAPTCPSGATFSACGDIFLGCCSTYACTTKGCPQGNLLPVAFSASQHGKFPDASCGDGADFWTCTAGPTFWGCCKSNPCRNGGVCPEGDLTGAFVGNPVQSAYYLEGVRAEATSVVSRGAEATGTMTTTTAATTTSAAESGASSAGPVDQRSSHAGAIAGGAAAGGVVIALLVCWLVYYIRYIRRARRNAQGGIETRGSQVGVVSVAEQPDKMVPAYGSSTVEHYARGGGGYFSPVTPPEYVSAHPSMYGCHGNGSDTFVYQGGVGGGFGAWKPGHRAQPSELEGETVWRGELESPMGSLRGGDGKCGPAGVKERPTRTTTREARWVEVEQTVGTHTMTGDGTAMGDFGSVRRCS